MNKFKAYLYYRLSFPSEKFSELLQNKEEAILIEQQVQVSNSV